METSDTYAESNVATLKAVLPEQAGHSNRDPRHFDRTPSKEVCQLVGSSTGDYTVYNQKSS